MRATILPVLTLAVAAAFSTPSFAASGMGQPHLKSCNRHADAKGISGRARSEAVQDCMEPSKKHMHKKPMKKHHMG